ncbi:MurR/RpiR family transcriptional regulator [Rhodococcus sp. KBS0724]|uniref:MurR/RpiR family transcriptional regulator n=1 Tax=Rhodococcus sp. KBS0724 TaxID=1179674 RepID=UPI00110EFEF8|nr:MurR/RpiR family transcriptional regulator [Rhodococcus sp. KBS0724]TSD49758.1 MurR/RpiR family transcriptional regulator [Rhodococcus sp. KBS0724]
MAIEEWLADRDGRDTLSLGGKKVVNVLVRAPQFASYASAREVAERAEVNVSTVVRTAQQLGFAGWQELREELRAIYLGAVGTRNGSTTEPTEATQLFRQDSANIAALATDANLAAIRATAVAIKRSRRTLVVTSGVGAAPAQVLGTLGAVYGLDIQVSSGHPTTQAIQVNSLGETDCLVVINVWRLTRTLRGLTRMGRERGATVCVLTDLRSSRLADDAAHLIVSPIEGIDGSVSVTAMVAAVQAVLGELRDPDSDRAAGVVQKVWNELDLMDNQD